ncbi:MAG: hypothetical protein H0Z35_08565 [Thermoanaerobacteraceae bacterium]|nr:hypothetical protein [Thermoanaerobacteraceae bacterium]
MRKGKVLLLLLGVLVMTALLVAGCGGQNAEEPEQDQQQAAQEQQQNDEQAQQEAKEEQGAEKEQPEEAKQEEQASGGEAQGEKEEITYVSSDEKAEGCVSCHIKVSEEKDYTLTAEMAAMNKEFNHPQLEVEGPQDCLTCHQDGDNSLDKVLHKAHLTGEENHFVSNYDGSCVHCHTLTADNEMVVKGLAQDVELQVIKSSSKDFGKENCNSCHRKVSEEKDYTLTAELKAMKEEFNHPAMEVKNGEDCLTCHKPDGDNPLDKAVHKVHLTGEDNHFVSNYGGSCRNCHAVAETGEMTTKLK